MIRTRRLLLIAIGLALTGGAALGSGSAHADTEPVVLRSGYILCTGVDGASGVCIEDPATILERVPGVRQLLYDLTGIG